MTTFWSGWIMFLVTFNLGLTLFLFLWGLRVRIPTLPDGTTGHVWANGALREGVRRLPVWWVVVSAAMFALGIGYLILYPGFGANKGLLGWTAHGELAEHVAQTQAKLEPMMQKFSSTPVEQLANDPDALRMGHRLFQDNCASCHGATGHGNAALGAPSLADRDWLYGGDGDTLLASILDGRQGAMPPHGTSLGTAGVERVAQYVLSLSGSAHDGVKAALGKPEFAVCAACHGADGKGNHALGAPDLTDHIWLYGGSAASLEKTIRDGRFGVMPAWRGRLTEQEARATAAWVYSLSQSSDSARQ